MMQSKNFKIFSKFLIISLLVFITRFIPHQPNFSIIITLAFYIPIFLGLGSSIFFLFIFIMTDFILGLHEVIFFTWASLLIISILAKSFGSNSINRFCGIIISTFIFFLITNLAVYLHSDHGINKDLIEIYILGLPYFKNSLLASIITSIFIEVFLTIRKNNILLIKKK